MEKMNLDSYLILYTKMNSRWIKIELLVFSPKPMPLIGFFISVKATVAF